MPYKDPEKRRKASQQSMQRKRQGLTSPKDVNPEELTREDTSRNHQLSTITPEGLSTAIPTDYGKPGCACLSCRANRASGNRHVINHGSYKPASRLGPKEINRVALPGDVDYSGVARMP